MDSSRQDAGFFRAGTLVAAIALVGITATVYYPSLSHEIIDLDYADWIQAAQPPGLDALLRIFAYDPSRWQHLGYFAPLTAASFMVDLWIGGRATDLTVAHMALNLLLHLANGLLVLWLMRLLGFDSWISFTAACLFSIHPLQVSTVCWVPERKNLLASFFFLLGLISYVRFRLYGKPLSYAAAVGAFVLSLLSKPSAVVMGPCIVLTDWFLLDRKLTTKSLLRAAPFLVLGIGWAILAAATEPPVTRALPLLDRMLLAPYGILFLAWKFFAPIGLGFIYPPTHVDAGSFAWWLPSFLFLGLGCLICAVHRFTPLWKLLWAVCFFLINVMPSAGLIPFGGMRELYVANHYQYLAAVGSAAVAAISAEWAIHRFAPQTERAMKTIFCCAAVFFLGLLSVHQLKTWENGEALWKSVIQMNPSCYVAHSNYGTYLHVRGRSDEAARQYEQALAVNPTAYKMLFNLGLLSVQKGNLIEAANYFRRVVEIHPSLASAHLALAEIYFSQQRYQEALQHCRTAQAYGAECPPEVLEMAIRQHPEIGQHSRRELPVGRLGVGRDEL